MGSILEENETAIELTYRAQLSEWLTVQADYQHIINPGMQGSLDNANVLLCRIEIAL